MWLVVIWNRGWSRVRDLYVESDESVPYLEMSPANLRISFF